MQLTMFGKEVRKYRIEANAKLKEMAQALKVSSAYLSAVEMGRKPLNDAVVSGAVEFFRKRKIDAHNLFELADRSRTRLDLTSYSDESKALLLAFARRLPELTERKRKFWLEELDGDAT